MTRLLITVFAAQLWITLTCPQLGFAQLPTGIDTSEYYLLEDNYPRQSLFSKTDIFIESDRISSIDELLAADAPDHFRPLDRENLFLDHPGSVWLRVKILPKISIRDWWLFMKRDTTAFEYVAALDEVDVYTVQEGEVIRHARTGVYVPPTHKDITEHVTVNRVIVHFEAGQPTVLYIHIQDGDWINNLLELRDPELFVLPPLGAHTPGLYISSIAALIIGIYVLCFFFYTYDWSFLYLFGMLMCLFLHYQILHPYMPLIDWLFPRHPEWVEPAWILLTMGSFAFFLQFGRTFADLKRLAPFWDKVMLWNIYLILLVVVGRLLLWFGESPLLYKIEKGTPIIFALIPLTIVIRLAFFKDKLVRYFVLGAVWLFFFTIWGVLWELGLLPFFNMGPWLVAQVGFMLIYAFGLAYKLQISERARSEVQRVKEIDSIKSQFFANISHEFRTPLSLILGPVNQSLEAAPASEELEAETEVPVRGKYLKVIRRNALRLQNLIDQILDLSKLDQGSMKLQVAPGDIVQFIRSLVFSFESLAERKHIHFHTHFPQSPQEAWFDRDKLEKILVNLLSNAFKFTPEHGEVSVQVSVKDQRLRLAVSDSGKGMKVAEAEKIFDRFYQTESTQDQGTGIGLSLVKELVELHRGQISVESVEGKSTSFKVVLPYRQGDFQPDELAVSVEGTAGTRQAVDVADAVLGQVPEHNGYSGSELPLSLIVEDNPDLRHYIAEQLAREYQVVMAVDGMEGLEIAEKQLPDLIISDVMMPRMNGIELCKTLKTNIKTSHIPVILLTAKAGQEAKLQGLQTGADAYLTKPFDGRELRVRSQQLIEQRKHLREKYAGEFRLGPDRVELNSMDEQFLQQVKHEIENNMDNEYFSVEDLAGAVGFSRSQLNRKLKGLTDKSPNQLIREFRLNRAKELLEQRTASVSEIAYQVGYSNLSYFSKSYKDNFGISPSEV